MEEEAGVLVVEETVVRNADKDRWEVLVVRVRR